MLNKPQVYVVHVTGHPEVQSLGLGWSLCDVVRSPLLLSFGSTILRMRLLSSRCPHACKLVDPAPRTLALGGEGDTQAWKKAKGPKTFSTQGFAF